MARTSLVLLIAVLLLGGCARHAPPASGANPAATAAAPARPPNSAPWSGRVLRGGDPDALRAYLKSVQEVKPTKFDVHWNPATVAVDKDAALRSLRSVSRSGATFVFAAGEPVVAKLKPGSILWIYDLALRKVDMVSTQQGLTRVHTQPVTLNEAIPDGTIEFEAGVPVHNFLLSRPAAPPPDKSTAARRHAPGAFVPVLYTGADPPQPGGGAAPAPAAQPGAQPPDDEPDPGDDEDADDAQEEAFQGNAYTGSLKGMQYSVGYNPAGDGALKLTLEARDAEDDAGGGDDSDAADSKDKEEKYKEAQKEEQEARDAIRKARQDDWNDEQEIRNLDDDYQKQLAQMKQDDLDRRNPNYSGPTPPPRPTDSNGTPYTEQALEQKLTQQYEQQRSLAVKKLAARREILAQWEAKKEQAERQKKMLKAAGKMLKDLFAIASDNVDVRFKVDAQLRGFSTAGLYQFANGELEKAQMQFKNLNGTAKAAFIGRLGKPGNKGLKIPIMHVPVSFNVPMPVGGLPFVVQVGADFLVTVFLAGNHATLNVNGEYAFNGTSGFTYNKTTATMTDSSNFSGGVPGVTSYQGASPGVSAVVLGVQLPRLGFGLGVTGVASSVAYFDVVHVLTMTESADAAIGMLAPRCKRITYNATGHVGVQTDVVLIPVEFVQKWASDKASGKKEIFNHTREVLDPPVKACEL